VPPQPLSLKKLVLFIVVGLLFIGGITLAAWEEGRVGLFSSFGLKGYKRREADGLMVASKGKKPDFKEAFRLYQIDADKGDGEALRKIGEMYRDGKGVPQSDAKARESWIKAAAPGDISTLLWLADKYRDGDGQAFPINNPEGIRLLRRAASQGDAGAQKKLALQLLAYADEYQMRLAFDEILSARQQMELLSLPKVAELIDANEDAIKKMTKGYLAEKVAAVRADLSNILKEKFNWEAYFWLSLSAASNDDVDLRARREGALRRQHGRDAEVASVAAQQVEGQVLPYQVGVACHQPTQSSHDSGLVPRKVRGS
jgi:TPR repeat protein